MWADRCLYDERELVSELSSKSLVQIPAGIALSGPQGDTAPGLTPPGSSR